MTSDVPSKLELHHLCPALLTGATLLLAACVAPEDSNRMFPTDAQVEAYNAQVDPEDQIVCRTEKPTGTRIPRRRCRTVGSMDDLEDFSKTLMRRILSAQ